MNIYGAGKSVVLDDDDLQILETPPLQVNQSPMANTQDTTMTQREKKKKRALTSDVWNHLIKIGIGIDGKEKCKCKGCGSILGCKATGGTTHLIRHVDSCKFLLEKHGNVGDMLLDMEGKLKRRKFDQKVNREIIAEMIITHGAPFNIVEWQAFRKYQKIMNEECRWISRNTIKADVMEIYKVEKERLRSQLAQISGRICLTSDCWTSCTNHGFISLTAHFVDMNWNLNNKILAFSHLKPPHSGPQLALKVMELLREWGIERKVFSLTLDNASANDNMQNYLKEHLGLSSSLLLNGEFFHIRCCAHVLNRIVQDGLKVASDVLHKIRQSVHYVRASESRTIQFFNCVNNVDGIDTSIGLRTDTPTRCNSTYIMLESAINYQRAFYTLSLCDPNYKLCPSIVEWKRAEVICEVLKPFYNITNLISGSSYPTSNLYIREIWKIECLLKSNLTSEDCVIKSMTIKMREKFDKYWSEYSTVLAFGATLDLTKKLNFFSFAYKQVDPLEAEEKLKIVKNDLSRLYEEYVKNGSHSSNIRHSQQVNSSYGGSNAKMPQSLYVCEEFEEYESQTVSAAGTSELDVYLAEQRLPPSIGFDILAFWTERSRRCLDLAKMACDVLSIPITTVASEFAFSIGVRVLNKYRSSLKDDIVQALMCARSWLHGFVEYDIDSDEDEDKREVIRQENLG
ncbi:unnamed protein product [Lathyrus sativus]|nr:unnamed protein product [Lathyrus sativus]